MGAKTACKKGYNTKENYVEFKENGLCPVSGVGACEVCNAKVFKYESDSEDK